MLRGCCSLSPSSGINPGSVYSPAYKKKRMQKGQTADFDSYYGLLYAQRMSHRYSVQNIHTVVCRRTQRHNSVLEADRKCFLLTRNVFLLVLIFGASQGGEKKKKRYFSMRN